jgi:translocation and assembly module TamB
MPLDIEHRSARPRPWRPGERNPRLFVERRPVRKLDLNVKGLSRSGLVLTSQPIDLGLAAVISGDNSRASSSGGQQRPHHRACPGALRPGRQCADHDRSSPRALVRPASLPGTGGHAVAAVGDRDFDLTGPAAIAADIRGTLENPTVRLASHPECAARKHRHRNGDREPRHSRPVRGTEARLSRIAGRTPGGGGIEGRDRSPSPKAVPSSTWRSMRVRRGCSTATTSQRRLQARSRSSRATAAGRSRAICGSTAAGSRSARQAARPRFRRSSQARRPRRSRRHRCPAAQPVEARRRYRRRQPAGSGARNPKHLDHRHQSWGNADRRPLPAAPTSSAAITNSPGEPSGWIAESSASGARSPPNPLLDIRAEAQVQGLDATVLVQGTGLNPEISFASVPQLPQDELLSRILFGTSITNLSAPEALQLASAVAALERGLGQPRPDQRGPQGSRTRPASDSSGRHRNRPANGGGCGQIYRTKAVCGGHHRRAAIFRHTRRI